MTTITIEGQEYPLKLSKRKREPVCAELWYSVQLQFSHIATLRMIEADCDGRLDNDRIIPRGWELHEACEAPEPWAVFQKDEPFDEQEVRTVLRKIDIFDQAAHLMTEP